MPLRDKVKTLWSSIPLNLDTITLEFVSNYKQTRSNNRYASSRMTLTLVDYIGVSKAFTIHAFFASSCFDNELYKRS